MTFVALAAISYVMTSVVFPSGIVTVMGYVGALRRASVVLDASGYVPLLPFPATMQTWKGIASEYWHMPLLLWLLTKMSLSAKVRGTLLSSW